MFRKTRLAMLSTLAMLSLGGAMGSGMTAGTAPTIQRVKRGANISTDNNYHETFSAFPKAAKKIGYIEVDGSSQAGLCVAAVLDDGQRTELYRDENGKAIIDYQFDSRDFGQGLGIDSEYLIFDFTRMKGLDSIYQNNIDVEVKSEGFLSSFSDRPNAIASSEPYQDIDSGALEVQFKLVRDYEFQGGEGYVFADHGRATFCDLYEWNPSTLQDGETAEVYVNVDDPLSIEQILANVRAEDLLGESVEVQCTAEEKAKYKPSTIGSYKVTVTATDNYGQMATCYLNIHVVDTVAPTISLVKAFDFTVVSTLQFSRISEYVSITDNGTDHGGSIGDPSYAIDGQAFDSDRTWQANDVGDHKLKVTVADSSGNTSTKEFSIVVRDTQAPVITMKDGGDGNLLIGLSRVLGFTKEEFLELFQATDNVTSSGEIVMDVEGEFIPSKVGSYDITVIATDKAGNKGTYTCHVTVDADLPPVFILSDALVGATAENPLSSSQIQMIVTNAIYAGKDVSNVLIDDSKYQANAKRAGSYPVTYSVQVRNADGSVTTENGKMTVRVAKDGASSEDELSAWERFCRWWTDGWQCFCNWFRGVFTKFEWDCWITDEQWDERFPEDAAE